MERKPVSDLSVGQILARNVRVGGRTLLDQGHKLSSRDISYLKAQGVRSVYVGGAAPAKKHRPFLSRETHEQTVDQVREIYMDYEKLNPGTLKVIRTLASEIVSSIMNADSLRLGVNDLRAYDEYTFRHSVNVTAISVAMARLVGIEGRKLHYLAASTLVHDIGKMKIPKELLNKDGPPTSEELALLRRHPEFGLKILSERIGGSPLEWATVYQHHENMDGTGYPDGKKGTQIHSFARLVAVADKYDALRSDRAYKKGWPPHQVMNMLTGPSMAARLDQHALDALDRMVIRFPLGARIQLSEGTWAVVTANEERNRDRPIVKLETDSERLGSRGAEVDLADREDVLVLDMVA